MDLNKVRKFGSMMRDSDIQSGLVMKDTLYVLNHIISEKKLLRVNLILDLGSYPTK